MTDALATELTVVRHGQTQWNLLGKAQGHGDSPLTPLGLAQARAAAEALADTHAHAPQAYEALYSSDLGRARATAELIGQRLGLEVRTDARLRERHLGVLQGLTLAEFQQRHPDHYARYRRRDEEYDLAGGESLHAMRARTIASGEALAARHPGRRLLVVAHGGTIDMMLRHTLGIPLTARRTFSLFNTALNVFTIAASRWHLQHWGDVHHLQGLATQDDQ